jgi:hypothetical protein
MNVVIFKMLEREIFDLNFEIDEITDEIANADADDDLDVDALVERRKQLEHRRARLQMRILDLIR